MRAKQPATRGAARQRRAAARPADTGARAEAALATIAAALGDRKAVNGVVLDLRHLSDAADYFVVVSGTSDTHVRAIAEHVIERMAESGSGRAHHVEGLTAGRWVLLDFVDVVVHVFHPSLREFYQLETLWADAPQRSLE
jgi:ribosome-associated protein